MEEFKYSLFDDNRLNVPTAARDLEAPLRMKSEVEYAIKIAKNDKAVGPDKIYAEYLKLLDDENLNCLIGLFNLIYKTCEIPSV